jgi:integrase-like protein
MWEITAHGLRRSAATILLNHMGKDLQEIEELLRCKNIRTSVRYTHVGYKQTWQTPKRCPSPTSKAARFAIGPPPPSLSTGGLVTDARNTRGHANVTGPNADCFSFALASVNWSTVHAPSRNKEFEPWSVVVDNALQLALDCQILLPRCLREF